MPTRKKLLHVRSNRPLTGDATKPQLPESSFLDYGELAINYGEGIETLSIKNSENDIVTFSSDIYNSNTYTTKEETIENELVVATALTEHEDRLDGLDEAVAGKQDALTFDTTPTANSTNPVTSGGVYSALEDKQDAPLVVNITATTNSYTSDVTFANALAAFEAHKDVYINATFSNGSTDIEYGKYKVIGKSNYNDPLAIMQTPQPMLYAIERHYKTLEHVIKWTANSIILETNGLYSSEGVDNQVNGDAADGGINLKNSDGVTFFGINEYGRAYWGTMSRDETNPNTLATLGDITSQLTSIFSYKGTIGTNGTVSTLPANAAVGDTYQAVAGCPDVNNKAVEEGDLVVNIGTNAWTVVQNNIVVDSQLDSTSHNPVENSTITDVIRSNERVIAIALTRVNDNAGFNTDGEYDPQGTNYIANSSSLAESADLLDAAVASLDAAVDALAAQVSSGTLWEAGTGTSSLIPKNSGNTASGAKSVAIGNSTQATNSGELATGSYNSSTTANNGTETLFSVGNGTSSTRHNAFEVKGNGDIKLVLNEEDVILQEYLLDEEEVISSALNDLDTRVLANEYDITQLQSSKQNAFIAGSGLTLSGNSLYANTATASTLGVVKGGGNVTIAADGTLNTTATVEVDDELDDTSTNPVENRVITTTIRNNEYVTAAALSKIKESAGLENNGDYSPSGTNYITNASSLTEAVDMLDDAIGDIDDTLSSIPTTYATKAELENANPLVWIDYWTNTEPLGASNGEYWYDPNNVTLKVYETNSWTTVALNNRKLYIKLSSNEIYRYDGRDMTQMTINPTSLVTT